MNRRLIILASVVVAIVIVLVAVYFVFFNKPAAPGAVDGDPFGGIGSGDLPGGSAPGVLEEGIEFSGDAGVLVAPRLVRITSAPVAYGVSARYIPPVPASSSTPAVPEDIEVRFVERQSGNLYAYRAHARTLTRIGNQTIPGVREASWLKDGSLAYLRYLSEDLGTHVETYALPVEGDGFFLEQDLAAVAATGTASLLTLRSDTNGSIGTLANADGSSPKTAFTTTLSSVTASFFGRGYLVYTKPSAALEGYAFSVSSAGVWSRAIGPFPGLAAIGNPTGTYLLYSYATDSGVATALMDMATHTPAPLPIATMAEKCVFSPGGTSAYCAVPTALVRGLPDAWYRGGVSFSDRLWQIDVAERTATLLIDPASAGNAAIDAVSLTPDPTGDILLFINKRDGSLWSYDL